MASILRALQRALALAVLSLHAGLAVAEPESGWWWNPNESGRGFFIEMTAGILYVGGYFYTDDGRATWVSSGGPLTDPWHYEGTLQTYRNGQTLFGDYQPPAPAVDAGRITLHFTDDLHGTITWPGGTIPIERDVFDNGTATFQPGTGWWWNESESGRGYSIEIQGDSAFVVAFMYDDGGNPVWYFSAGPMATPTRYEGDILQFSGGQTLTGPYHPPATPDKIAKLTIDFLSIDEADLTFEDLVSDKAGAASTDKSTRRRNTRARRQFVPSVGPQDHWPFWRFNMRRVDTQIVGTLTQTLEHKYAGWFRLASVTPAGTATYTLDGDAQALITHHGIDTASGCEMDGQTLFSVQSGTLTITGRLAYSGSVGIVEAAPYQVAFRLVCPGGGGGGGLYPFFVADAFGGARSFVTVWYSALDLRPYAYAPLIVGDRTIAAAGNTSVRLGWVLGATAQRPPDPPQP